MFNINNFDQYREDNRLEAKRAKDGLPNSLWETYSSFANCYGGVIILGVTENKNGELNTTGLKDATKLKKDFWNTINNRKKVSINLLTDNDVETYDVNGDVIMVITVPKAAREDKPVHINDDMFAGTYRRNWEGDYHCTRSEVKAMLRDQPEETMDMKVLDDASLERLNFETLRSYRSRHKAYRDDGHIWEKLDEESFLEKIGAAKISKADGKLHPTAAGLLMFGEEFLILNEFPEYFLDYREMLDPTIRWTDRIHSSSGNWSGNLFDFYFRVYGKLLKYIKTPFNIVGGNRIDDTPVHKAVREALANCLVNTDFYIERGVVIKSEQDMFIIENPGSIRTGKHQMLRGGISDPRNKALMKMFNLIGIGERAGSGVPDIFATWENEGWDSPIVEEQYNPDRTVLTLPLMKCVSGKKVAIGDEKVAIGDEKVAIGDEKVAIGVEKEAIGDEKVAIGVEKEAIETIKSRLEDENISRIMTSNILNVYNNVAINQEFGRKDVASMNNCSYAHAGKIIYVMQKSQIIIPIKGKGKGKYIFSV